MADLNKAIKEFKNNQSGDPSGIISELFKPGVMGSKMTYNDKYEDIDHFMSDSNIGARKHKNIRNHLFVIYAIINSVIQGESV